jgi:hypothetical protein
MKRTGQRRKKNKSRSWKEDSILEETPKINWDLIQRMRFMNADAEIPPDDKYTRGEEKLK